MITWSNNWISDNDSLWSILAKFKVANVVDSNFIKNEYVKKTPTVLNDYLNVFLPDNFDYMALSEQLGLNLIHYFENQIDYFGISNVNLAAIKQLFNENLRYCPICIKNGFHSNLNQLNNIAYCPLHETVVLRETCEKCNLPINIYNAAIDYTDYYCKCGNVLTESNDFGVMKSLWIKTTKQTNIERHFSEKQFVILETSVGKRIGISSDPHIFRYKRLYKINNAHSKNYKKDNNDFISVYKCFLRRIRRLCLKKCIKKHFKQGHLANLCVFCRAYFKLRSHFELIKNEWDLYYSVGGIALNPQSSVLLNSIIFTDIGSHLKLADFSDQASFNIQMYALFHSLKMCYSNWVTYLTNRCYENEMTLCFSISLGNKTDLNLTIENIN